MSEPYNPREIRADYALWLADPDFARGLGINPASFVVLPEYVPILHHPTEHGAVGMVLGMAMPVLIFGP